jgi:hypothetical protein
LFGVGRVADFTEDGDVGAVLASSGEGLLDVVDVGLFVGDAAGLEEGEFEFFHWWVADIWMMSGYECNRL